MVEKTPVNISSSSSSENEKSDDESDSSQHSDMSNEQRKIRKIQRQLENSIADDMEVGATMQHIGLIPSNIYLNSKGGSLKYFAEAGTASIVVKLSIHKFGKCLATDPKNWWKDSPFRCQVVLSSKDYPALKKTRDLQMELKKVQKKLPGNTITLAKNFSNH